MADEIDPRLQKLVGEFGAEIGLPSLTVDEDGFRSLTFDGKVTVNLQLNESRDQIILFAELGVVPTEERSETYEALLKANFFWQATHGATLSVDGDEPTVVIAANVDWSTISSNALSERIRRFVDAAEDWMDFVNGAGEFAGVAAMDGDVGSFMKV